ncbi:hypothetical protein [Flavobacterium sp. ASW18X]|uniref:hypothetical protein n=1 Tax=Flavobacterium sp. ASW18X TaxID=2572595 RepID=UPI0010ADCF52|nr:hypothetical protein [Flavobacterium sp. ASW18X]TKD61348.1 hypothetical protein FBT53_11220 [Flavobacterium sp. ASW18X]
MKLSYNHKIIFFSAILNGIFTINISAQETCLLGIGGKDDEAIIDFFKLTDTQQAKLRNWGAEMNYRNEVHQNKLKSLLRNHPKETLEDLRTMAYKQKSLLDSMEANMRLVDKRLLGIFTVEQYNAYVLLCNGVQRIPIYVDKSFNEKKQRP